MQNTFNDLADHLATLLKGDESFTAWISAEESSFVRFNHGKVRQPGAVKQAALRVDLIDGKRHAPGDVSLSGDKQLDLERLNGLVKSLREKLAHLPEDPHLLINTEVTSTENASDSQLPSGEDIVSEIVATAEGTDMVGIYAGGPVHRGFANSMGQRNWFSRTSFNFDWSLYHAGDKAVKSSYAGFDFNRDALANKMAQAREQLQVLGKSPKTIEPGKYRVYLAPAAVQEVLSLLSWGAFGLKAHRTKTTSLIRMAEEDAQLASDIHLVENIKEGAGPAFGQSGFIKPDAVDLIAGGQLQSTLVSPRSAKEYGVETNGAGNDESPTALHLGSGELGADDVLTKLDTGVYVNNLWYLNYSDRKACRMTGMTRFATFWVENGEIVAPLNVMRFDETLYRMFGDNLEGLTADREVMLDPNTYGQRSTDSTKLPGALVRDFSFTL